jgi:glycosyltransferase involved in cell wall biosynthesis
VSEIVTEEPTGTKLATLVLISRTGDGLPGDDELSRIRSGREIEVLLAVAPWRPGIHPRTDRAALEFPPAAPWGDVIAACVERARGERIAFVELPAVQSLARVPQLLDELEHADVVGARLLRRDGITLESCGGGFSSVSYALELDSGAIASTLPMERRSVLWVDRRAFAAYRDALIATGPPHASAGDVLAEVDWGWRLSLAGHRVACAPIVIPIDEGVGPPRASALDEEGARVRAGIALLVSMLEPASLDLALAHNPAAAAALAGGTSARAIHAWEPDLRNRRAAVQMARRRDDAALAAGLGAALVIDRPAAVARIVGTRRRAGRPRVAILCSDVVGDGLAGPAIRALESARVLADRFDVQIGVRDATASIDAPCPVRRLSAPVVRELLAHSDAIVLQGPVSDWYPEILASDVPIAVDLYDPMNLEALEGRHADQLVPYTTQLLRAQAQRGDFFFCASERQRDYWIGMLAGLGRVTSAAYRADPDLRQLVDVVPFGIPSEPPRRTAPGVRGVVAGIGADDPLFVWNGGLWGWFEPELFIRAIDSARLRVPNVRAYFMGVRDPRSNELSREATSAIELAERLGLRDAHVFFNDWTPYDTRENVYLDATAAVSFHRAHLETRFSFRTRILDCIWSSLPIVCSAGDVLADLVRNEQLGLTVPPGDLEAATDAIVRIAGDDALRQASRDNLAALAHRHTWSTSLEPLAAWLARAERSSPAMDLDTFVRDQRTDPAPGTFAARVPLPLRQHVLGPAKRRLQRAATRLGDS